MVVLERLVYRGGDWLGARGGSGGDWLGARGGSGGDWLGVGGEGGGPPATGTGPVVGGTSGSV